MIVPVVHRHLRERNYLILSFQPLLWLEMLSATPTFMGPRKSKVLPSALPFKLLKLIRDWRALDEISPSDNHHLELELLSNKVQLPMQLRIPLAVEDQLETLNCAQVLWRRLSSYQKENGSLVEPKTVETQENNKTTSEPSLYNKSRENEDRLHFGKSRPNYNIKGSQNSRNKVPLEHTARNWEAKGKLQG